MLHWFFALRLPPPLQAPRHIWWPLSTVMLHDTTKIMHYILNRTNKIIFWRKNLFQNIVTLGFLQGMPMFKKYLLFNRKNLLHNKLPFYISFVLFSFTQHTSLHFSISFNKFFEHYAVLTKMYVQLYSYFV